MSAAVHHLLRQQKDEVLRSWETRVASEDRDVAQLGLALRKDIPGLLDALADWLAADEPLEPSHALSHVMQRLDEGSSLVHVFREFRLLRQTIIEAVLGADADEQNQAGAVGEQDRIAWVKDLARLNAGLDLVLSRIVVEFTAERGLERARAEEAQRASEERLAADVAALTRMHSLSARVVEGSSIEPLLRETVDAAIAVMGADKGNLQLVEGDSLRIVAHSGYDSAFLDYFAAAEKVASTCGEATRRGERVVVPDVETSPIFAATASLQVLRAAGLRSVQSTPLRTRSGRLLGILTTHWKEPHAPAAHDLSRLDLLVRQAADLIDVKQSQDALREANERLRDADRRKTEFLAMLSHELRNPLAPIRNGIYLLEHAAPDSEQATRAREVVRRQTEHLRRLVDDLLDVTRISHGKIPLERSRVDLREIVRKTTDDLHSVFVQAGIQLRVDHLTAGPMWIEADSTRLAQVLANLLNNSLKFTQSGGTVRVSVAARSGRAELCVMDDGIGMEQKEIEHVFEPFWQAEQSLARTKGGLGLGLALVKSIVELHGGTVEARSEGPGRGTEFLARIPLIDEGPASDKPGPPANGTTPRTILVIEDNHDGAQSLADLLELQGHRVRVAHDGHSGIALARELRPDVILCDIGLPDVDGYDVALTLRREVPLRGTRLVALSGYAQPEDRERASDAGFDAHLAKPVELEELMAALAKDS